MADQNIALEVTKKAAADLSSSQYLVGKLDTDGNITDVAASTDVPFGIIQNKPVTNEATRVVPIGPGGSSKIKLGEVIDEGALISFSATGTAVAAASGSYTIGLMETGGNTGDNGKVLLNNLIIKA